MVNVNERLSTNFTLRELLTSSTAERDANLKALQYNPPAAVVESLRYLVTRVLQPVRDELGAPVRITSGYRHPILNKLVGGSATSQHCLGEAADCQLSSTFLDDPRHEQIRERINSEVFTATGRDLSRGVNANHYLFAWMCLHLQRYDIDQVIHEYGDDLGAPAWVHIAASRTRDRRQILIVGSYTDNKYVLADAAQALQYDTLRLA